MNNPWRLTGTATLLILLSAPAYAELATIKHGTWSSEQKESEHDFKCPSNQVLVGREHRGDENKMSYYLCATVTQKETLQTFHEQKIMVTDTGSTCPDSGVMTGRGRKGDENSPYWLYCAEVRDVWGKPLVPSHTSSLPVEEHKHTAVCGENEVIWGMSHYGDENGLTRYYCTQLY